MTGPEAVPPGAPSTAAIAKAAGAALLVAAVILLTVVLPAEYGVDPLGTGRILGLTQMAGTARPSGRPQAPASDDAPVRAGVNTPAAGAYKQDARVVTIGPYEGMEFKYRLMKGSAMLYSWKASASVKYEFQWRAGWRAARLLRELRQAGEGWCERQLHRALFGHPRVVLGE